MIEDFKNCLPKDVKTHIDEGKVETSYKLTMLADKCGVTHRRSKTKPSYHYNLGTQTWETWIMKEGEVTARKSGIYN